MIIVGYNCLFPNKSLDLRRLYFFFMPQCLECQDPIFGRADKKFCSDACRNAYNNRMNKRKDAEVLRINGILKKNYQILNTLTLKEGKTVCKKEDLISKGYDFLYHTHTITYKNGSTYRFLYQYGYRDLEDGKILVVKKEEDS